MKYRDDSAKDSQKLPRFSFGLNWSKYVESVSLDNIDAAKLSMVSLLCVQDLAYKRFIDVGCGSGLFSLAARKLGAEVVSFDYDQHSVNSSEKLKHRYSRNDKKWDIVQGSILDRDYIEELGVFDIVYCWGVLHHTGNMWLALDNIDCLVGKGGKLAIAIYNDQGWVSKYWKTIKKIYVQQPLLQWPLILLHYPYLVSLPYIYRKLYKREPLERGMNLWYDLIDWVGGYPFEVAKPNLIIDFYEKRDYKLINLKTCGSRHGCNEFVFIKN